MSVKIKQAVAEELSSVNARLAEKENEIKLLKEMVRSTNLQMQCVEKDALVFRKGEAARSPRLVGASPQREAH